MEIVEAREFLKHNHHGVLVARKRDGSLQMTLVSPVIGMDGKVTITARESTYKVKNIRRNPQVSLLVYGEKFNGSNYIQIDGKAEVIPLPQIRVRHLPGSSSRWSRTSSGWRSAPSAPMSCCAWNRSAGGACPTCC